MRRAAAAVFCFLSLTACQREERNLRPSPGQVVLFGDAARESDLLPGGSQPAQTVANPAHGNAYEISEGQRLFGWYNCSGCHSNGGGGIGPPLIKDSWIYGGEPANLFDTIVKGRPNGMPAWGGKIPEYQIWQLVAYVRSMNQKEPQAATPVRLDVIQKDPGTLKNKVQGETK
jgi:cytochrome c oxidase cbb3-type subunit III